MSGEIVNNFWRNEHALPSKPRLVFGDVDTFKADCEAVKGRAAEYIDNCGSDRTLASASWWQEWWFHPEVWDVE